MNDLDTAGGGTGAGADKTHGIEKHLGGLGPPFIVCGGETGGGQQGHDLECTVSGAVHEAVVCILLP